MGDIILNALYVMALIWSYSELLLGFICGICFVFALDEIECLYREWRIKQKAWCRYVESASDVRNGFKFYE